MNDTSSKFDKHIYEAAMPTGDSAVFTPIDGVGVLEWCNISDIARAVHLITPISSSASLRDIATNDNRFKDEIERAYESLTSALAIGIIEIDERRKFRRAAGYSHGKKTTEGES